MAFKDADFAFFVSTKPQLARFSYQKWIRNNADLYVVNGKSIEDYAKRSCKNLVVGEPANLNALIASCNAPSIPHQQFHSLSRVEHNRATSYIATRTGTPIN